MTLENSHEFKSILNCTSNFTIENLCDSLIDKLDNRPFVPSILIQIIWTFLFCTMVLLAVLGNLTMISIILKTHGMRTKINLYLLNLSIADFLMATLNAMFNFISMLKSHWPFGEFYCKVNNFVANLAIAASVFTITITTFDRYCAVLYPLKPRNHNQIRIVILIWFISCLISSPLLIFSTTYSFIFSNGGTRTLCFIKWPDGYSFMSTYDAIYNIFFFLVTYAIPLIAMFFTYTRMFPVLKSRFIGDICSNNQLDALHAKRKAVLMLLCLAIMFAICWLPYHLYFFYIVFRPLDTQRPYVQHLFLGFYLLAMSNSTLNPMIYCLMNKRFRSTITRFCCLKSQTLRSESY